MLRTLFGERIAKTHRGLKIVVDTASRDIAPHIIREGRWEHWVEAVLRRLLHRGQTVAEVGANLGYHTLVMAEQIGPAGKLYSFEANPRLCRLLRRTIAINGLAALVELREAAATDEAGAYTLDFNPKMHGGGHLTVGGLGPDDQRVAVKGVTLDEELAQVPSLDMLRMDAEGAEVRVLRGAWALIDRSPTLIVVTEWNPRFLRAQIAGCVPILLGELAERGFRVWKIEPHTACLLPMSFDALAEDQHSDVVFSRQDVALADA
jgi:FkbM family methyltransferase